MLQGGSVLVKSERGMITLSVRDVLKACDACADMGQL